MSWTPGEHLGSTSECTDPRQTSARHPMRKALVYYFAFRWLPDYMLCLHPAFCSLIK